MKTKQAKHYCNSKKGFSLIELLCAIVVIAIVVGATATGLAISYKSVMLGGEKDKASALSQKYCDIIMCYIENTASNDPNASITEQSQKDKNILFADNPNLYFKFTDNVINKLKTDIPNMPTNPQYNSVADANAATKKRDNVYFVVESEGNYANADGKTYVTYKTTVFVDYTDNNTISCTGSVTKPQLAP